MPVPRYPEFERLLDDLRHQPDARFQPDIELAFNSAIENLANGDDVVFAFKWLCNDLEQLAFDGFRITPDLYRRIEAVGRAVGAPADHWKTLERYIAA
jgi:hypothetical protein